MFPISLYAKLGAIALVVVISVYFGYSFEHSRYMAYKQEIETIAKTQEAKVKSVQSQQELVTKGIQNEYEAKLSAIKFYYGGLRQSSSGKLSNLSNPASGTNESTADQLLACANTTQQLVSLQDWINEQIGIK
jgi:hypothetical protein